MPKLPRRPLRHEPNRTDHDGEDAENLADKEFGGGHRFFRALEAKRPSEMRLKSRQDQRFGNALARNTIQVGKQSQACVNMRHQSPRSSGYL